MGVEAALPYTGTLLDLGSGYGLLTNTAALLRPDLRVVGIERDPGRHAVARQSSLGRTNIDFLLADAVSSPLPPCDAVIASAFLHHVPFPAQHIVLERIAASLTRQGRLIMLEVPPEPWWKHALGFCLDQVLYPGQPVYYTPVGTMVTRLASLGFKVTYQSHPILSLVVYLAEKG
jgi:SAM-dependent methyltransferase